jgi:hypothetical protein
MTASRLRLGVGALATAAVIGALAAAPAAAQWQDPPLLCKHPSRTGYALSHWHSVPTWAPGVGLRAYRIRYSASTSKCGGVSQVVYHVSWDASDLPDSEEIIISMVSKTAAGKKKTACVRQYGGGTACVFSLKGGTTGPRFGATPWVQRRTTKGRNYVSTVVLYHGAIANGAGSAPATWPHSITLRPK